MGLSARKSQTISFFALSPLGERVGVRGNHQISRLESPSYEGHSLSMIRRVAEALGAAVRLKIEPLKPARHLSAAEKKSSYRVK